MPVPDRPRAVERHLLRETAYEALRDAIVDGMLAPGEVLRDAQLCRWLALSRTPVRAALARLCDDGLVEMAPQRYTRVAPLTAGEVRDVLPVVAVLHGLATELAVPRLGADDLAALRRENERFVLALRDGERDAALAADERFHLALVARCANREVARVVERLTPRLRRIERHLAAALPARRLIAQHQAILTRAGAGDAAAAASAVRENWLTLGAHLERAAPAAAD